MPAHISFQDRLLQIKGYAALKVGNLGIGPAKSIDRGFSLSDAGYYVAQLVKERQCVVPSYEMYRLLVEYWNPGRPAWTASATPQNPSQAHGRFARMGSHRGSRALDTFAGGHETKPDMKSVNGTSTVPVSPQEWSTYLAAGSPTDRMVRAIFEKNEGIGLMFVRGGGAKVDLEKMKLKRIEMGKGRIWDILWTNHDI